jgi:hypothetical protein
MVKAVSRGQALELSSRFAAQVNWDEIDGDVLQKEVVNLSREEFGRRFTAFLRNGARLIVVSLVLVLNRLVVFNPIESIGTGWTIWRGPKEGAGLEGVQAQDVCSLALQEVDWTKVHFDTSLREGETSIKGEEKLSRLLASGNILPDAQIGFQLLEDYKTKGKDSILEQLRRDRGITYIDFFGTILRDADGDRYVLYVFWNGVQWDWHVRWLVNDWDVSYFSAVLAKK